MQKELIVKGTQEFLGMNITVIEGGFGEGQKVILAKTIAEIHEMKVKEVNKLINSNIKEFEFGIDIIDLKTGYYEEPVLKNGLFTKAQWGNSNNVYLLSEQGYFALVQLMKTEKAKEIRKKLRREYFKMREAIKEVETIVQKNGVLTEQEWNKIKKKSKYLTENIYSGKSTREYIKGCDLMHLQDVIDNIYEVAKPCRGEIRYEILNNAIKTLKEISSQYDYSNPMNTFIKTVANDGVIKLQSIHTEKLVRETNNKDRKINSLKSDIDEAKNNALKKEKELLDIKEKYDPNGFWTTLNYHPFSVNYMYDDNKITDSYQRWIDNFPKDKLHSKEQYEKKLNIDFSKPIVIYIKYRNLAKFDLDNLSKSLIDYIFNRYFLVDDSIVKGKVEFIKEHCNSYKDGKISFTLRNMTDNEIARLDD